MYKPYLRSILIIIIVAQLACLSTPTPALDCTPASPQQIEHIRAGIKDIQQSNDIINCYTTQSNDYQRAYIVACGITGPGIETWVGPGIWIIAGEPAQPTTINSIDGYANQYTPYPNASQTDISASLNTHGVKEAFTCATQK
jgi:hypothetical protein